MSCQVTTQYSKESPPWGSPQVVVETIMGNGSGQRRQPPNIDDLIRKAQGSVGRIFPGGQGGKKANLL